MQALGLLYHREKRVVTITTDDGGDDPLAKTKHQRNGGSTTTVEEAVETTVEPVMCLSRGALSHDEARELLSRAGEVYSREKLHRGEEQLFCVTDGWVAHSRNLIGVSPVTAVVLTKTANDGDAGMTAYNRVTDPTRHTRVPLSRACDAATCVLVDDVATLMKLARATREFSKVRPGFAAPSPDSPVSTTLEEVYNAYFTPSRVEARFAELHLRLLRVVSGLDGGVSLRAIPTTITTDLGHGKKKTRKLKRLSDMTLSSGGMVLSSPNISSSSDGLLAWAKRDSPGNNGRSPLLPRPGSMRNKRDGTGGVKEEEERRMEMLDNLLAPALIDDDGMAAWINEQSPRHGTNNKQQHEEDGERKEAEAEDEEEDAPLDSTIFPPPFSAPRWAKMSLAERTRQEDQEEEEEDDEEVVVAQVSSATGEAAAVLSLDVAPRTPFDEAEEEEEMIDGQPIGNYSTVKTPPDSPQRKRREVEDAVGKNVDETGPWRKKTNKSSSMDDDEVEGTTEAMKDSSYESPVVADRDVEAEEDLSRAESDKALALTRGIDVSDDLAASLEGSEEEEEEEEDEEPELLPPVETPEGSEVEEDDEEESAIPPVDSPPPSSGSDGSDGSEEEEESHSNRVDDDEEEAVPPADSPPPSSLDDDNDEVEEELNPQTESSRELDDDEDLVAAIPPPDSPPPSSVEEEDEEEKDEIDETEDNAIIIPPPPHPPGEDQDDDHDDAIKQQTSPSPPEEEHHSPSLLAPIIVGTTAALGAAMAVAAVGPVVSCEYHIHEEAAITIGRKSSSSLSKPQLKIEKFLIRGKLFVGSPDAKNARIVTRGRALGTGTMALRLEVIAPSSSSSSSSYNDESGESGAVSVSPEEFIVTLKKGSPRLPPFHFIDYRVEVDPVAPPSLPFKAACAVTHDRSSMRVKIDLIGNPRLETVNDLTVNLALRDDLLACIDEASSLISSSEEEENHDATTTTAEFKCEIVDWNQNSIKKMISWKYRGGTYPLGVSKTVSHVFRVRNGREAEAARLLGEGGKYDGFLAFQLKFLVPKSNLSGVTIEAAASLAGEQVVRVARRCQTNMTFV